MDHNWSNVTSSSQPQQFSSFLSESVSQHPSYPQIFHSSTSCRENHELPAISSWNQFLLSGLVEEKKKNNYGDFQTKKTENCETQLLYPPGRHHVSDEREKNNGNLYVENEELQAIGSTSSQFLPVTSPNSYVTGLRSNTLDFSGNIVEIQQQHPDQSSECNSYDNGGSWKKAKIQASSSAFKVKKEKLGDRIAALHQLVSPYGKTDTASVLLEVIGYIRFLQSQIEVLILPYLGDKSCRLSLEGQKSSVFSEDIYQDFENGKIKKDLRSKGLCLVPISVTLKVGNKNCGADFWAPSAFTG